MLKWWHWKNKLKLSLQVCKDKYKLLKWWINRKSIKMKSNWLGLFLHRSSRNSAAAGAELSLPEASSGVPQGPLCTGCLCAVPKGSVLELRVRSEQSYLNAKRERNRSRAAVTEVSHWQRSPLRPGATTRLAVPQRVNCSYNLCLCRAQCAHTLSTLPGVS